MSVIKVLLLGYDSFFSHSDSTSASLGDLRIYVFLATIKKFSLGASWNFKLSKNYFSLTFGLAYFEFGLLSLLVNLGTSIISYFIPKSKLLYSYSSF